LTTTDQSDGKIYETIRIAKFRGDKVYEIKEFSDRPSFEIFKL